MSHRTRIVEVADEEASARLRQLLPEDLGRLGWQFGGIFPSAIVPDPELGRDLLQLQEVPRLCKAQPTGLLTRRLDPAARAVAAAEGGGAAVALRAAQEFLRGLLKKREELQKKATKGEKLDEQRKNELLVMHMSRQQQMRWKKERKAQTTADDVHYASELKKLNVKLREEEAMAIRDKFERNKQRDAYLLQQMEDKSAALEAEKLQEMYDQFWRRSGFFTPYRAGYQY